MADFREQSSAPLLGTGNLAELAPAINAEMSVNAYVVPICVAGLENGNLLCARGIWQPRSLKVAPDILNRVKEIRARVVFSPGGGSAPENGRP